MMERILSRCPSAEICAAGICETSTAGSHRGDDCKTGGIPGHAAENPAGT